MSRFAVPPNVEFLLRCAMSACEHAKDPHIEDLLNRWIDQAQVASLMEDNRLYPLVWQALRLNRLTSGEGAEADRCAMIRHHNLWLTHQMAELQDYLWANDVIAIPFKGLIIAHMFYGDIGRRQIRDLDFIVHENQFDKTVSLLQLIGFCEYEDEEWDGAIHFFKHFDNFTLTLDMHNSFVTSRMIATKDTDDFWNNTIDITIEGRRIITFSRPIHFYIQCMHFVKGMIEGKPCLRDIIDINVCFCQYALSNWNDIIDDARKFQLHHAVTMCVYIALRRHCKLRHHVRIDRARAHLCNTIASHIYNDGTLKNWTLPMMSQICSSKNIGYGLYTFVYRYIHSFTTINAKDRSVVRIPEYFCWLYYFIKVYRVFRKYVI